VAALRPEFDGVLTQVAEAATLRLPAPAGGAGARGRDGEHAAALDEVLTEMQQLARSIPGGVW
jgi:ring-1,2-phenylacetyl-CoA epoxidase subunit PaaC